MYAQFDRHIHTHSELFRVIAAASGLTLVFCWIALLLAESVRCANIVPNIGSYPQAIALFVIFCSYAYAWRHALVGGALAILGTILFFVVGYYLTEMVPPWPAAMFALPGVLSLFAWAFSDRHPEAS